MKRCRVFFTGYSGEVYTDIVDGDHASVEKWIKNMMQAGLFEVSKWSEKESFDRERVWALNPRAIESICIEEFEEEED